MANFIFCFCVFRIALPFILAVSFLFRPSWLSVLYLLFLLFLPMVPVPTTESMTGITGIYLKLLLAVSTLTFTAQLVFQIVLLSLPPYGSILEKDEFLERMLRYAGLVRLDGITAVDVLTWISPEIIMFLTSIAIFVTCKKLVVENPEGANEEGVPINKTQPKKRNFGFLVTIGKYVVLASLCFAAVLRPSVQGGIYFIVFLSAATWWACYKELAKAFAIVLRIIMVLVVCHIGCLYAYQFDWTQEVVGNTSYARYFGLTGLYNATSSSSRHFEWNDYEWATYVNPVALLWLYYVLALESKFLLKPQSQKKQGPFSRLEGSFSDPLVRRMSQRLSNRRLVRSGTTRRRWQSATRKVRVKIDNSDPSNVGETTPLIRGVSPSSRRYGSGSKRSGGSILQDSTGSVTVTGDTTEDIPMQQLEEEDYEPTLLDNILFAFETLVQVIIRSSYIGTNIIMMAWSITYLSWLTFVLLIWANLLWLVPNQRKSMLRSSPALVVYAWFLLLSAYIYSMDLTEEELPSTVKGINFAQIGFQKVTVLPCNPLLVKCLYSIMFWITLRQYMQERHEAKQTSALADMVAPLQVTVRAATGAPKEEEKGSKIMKIIGDHLKNFLTKFWIWIVAITLFTVAITGERMTAFRIIYMALFLFFVLTFQLSFRIWRKMMFGFWLTVIVYSMAILVMVYTYQFDNFPTYWQEYLHVPVEQQHDLGLEIFETKQLFVRLVTPTFFVIITVIQLHYFHKDFMELSDTKSVNVTDGGSEGSSVQEGAFDPSSEKTDISDVKIDFTDLANVSMNQLQVAYKHWLKKFLHFKNLTFLFLELHMPKIVLLMAMMVCVYDKCAMHFVIVVLIALAFTFGRSVQVFCIYSSSALVSVLLLARMVYQIQYIEHDRWNGTCNFTSPSNKSALEVTTPLFQNISTNETKYNSAEWLGFRKSTYLPGLVKWNIIYILTVTLWSVVLVRQFNHRVSRGKPTSRPFFMFPKITRAEADKNLRNCVKYLANYGFYKFGVEISFMAIVALIGFRMDLYATIHAIWLCIMISMSRTTLSKIWNFYLAFVGISLPYQYFMSVGLPPSLCIDYPWLHSVLLRKFQEWAYLLDYQIPPAPKKLICDFVLLLMVSRQSVVFRIERRYKEREYPGGTNDVIIHHAEEKDFVNPVPDFVTYVRTYLDIFKRAFLLSFLWITLAIVFLAGTNRVNVFSIGYLIGAFIFLWHGTDLYLKPIPVILKSWNILLAYNVAVIFLKTALQIVGCVFIQELPASMCWPVQLFAIGCVRKFGNVEDFIVEQKGSEHCTVPREYIGLVWDGLCFGFLLVQRRIFHSYNFFHMIDEAKATTILASRGAELIAELRQKKMTEQDEQERRILEKIKAKMDKIKANQQKIHETGYKDTSSHFVAQPPLARTPSMTSCTSATSQQTSPAGYHTPIDDEEPAPLTPHAGSLLQTQAPSPYSAVMTVSLDGYLEPQRMSFSSPPNSDLNPRPPSPDDSFPVFSPPPYDEAPPYTEAVSEPPTAVRRQSSIGPPWMQGSFVTPRQSVISYSSRSPLSHHTYRIFSKSRPLYQKTQPKTYKQAIRSGDYYMFDDLEDDELEMIDSKELDEEEEKDRLKRTASKKRTVGELLSSAMKTDITTTLRSTTPHDLQRRASMPLSRQRSTMSARSQFSAPLSAPPTVDEPSRKEVVIVEESEPKPGTSKDEDFSELSEPKDISLWQKILNYILFAWAFIDSLMISLTNYLNRYSKDYRYVAKVLTKEKKILKEKTDFSVGLRLGSGKVWQPAGSYHSLLQNSRAGSVDTIATAGTEYPSDSYRIAMINARRSELKKLDDEDSTEKPPLSEDSDTKAVASPLPYSSERDRRKASVLTVPEIRILAPSLERGLDSPISHSGKSLPSDVIDEYEEMSSYDQPSIFRLLLAVWYIVLSHSDILCYFIIFLNQIKSATFLSLPLPLLVFLWGSLSTPRPTKTFWVTIIAYTEIIVLIKCMFQFDIISWNKRQDLHPFYAPRIIGIERKKNYAVWDLLVLLVVFFHRFLLKALGLWKSNPIVAAKLADGEYKVEDGELKPVKNKTPESASSPINGLDSGTNAKHLPPRKGSDLQRLVEETEDVGDDEKKQVTSISSEDHSKLQESIISGEASDKIVSLRSEEVDASENLPNALQLALSKYAESIKNFFAELQDPTSRVSADVYSYMFLCDFFNFFVIILGFSAFGTQQGDGGVTSYLEENRVPVLFLLMLILQFTLIIVDRAIYLRKFIFGKIVFQFLQVFILHIWLFVIFPIITERNFNSVIPPQMYYMVKCFYLLLSAYQIRCGYPSRILGNFLCKGYTYVNMFLFKAFMIVPFLFELRTVMDWMWTDTSMTVFDWIKMEDIFAHIFQLKCSRHAENEYPQPRGERKSPMTKYMMGGAILFIIIAIIWFPLVFFSLGSAVGEPNKPYDVTLDLRIGPYEPVYHISAQANSIFQFKEYELKNLTDTYIQDKAAVTFLSNYEAADIAAVSFITDSANVWGISPPDRKRMIAEVNSSNPITVRLEYQISHKSNTKEDPGTFRNEVEITLEGIVDGKQNPERQRLFEMLQNQNGVEPISLNYILPKFLKVTNRGTVTPVSVLMKPDPVEEAKSLRTVTLKLDSDSSAGSLTEWWEIREICNDSNYDVVGRLPYSDCNSIVLYTFNDKIFPATLNFITGAGIIGLYTTLVFVASRVLRGFFAEICFKIMFDDMPNVDRVLQLCLDIYLVREAREFSLEEDLFAKLVFLFRSPETLIKWTRPKEELEDDEDPEGENDE